MSMFKKPNDKPYLDVHEEIELVRTKVTKDMREEYFEQINKLLSVARDTGFQFASHYDEDLEVFYIWIGGYSGWKLKELRNKK